MNACLGRVRLHLPLNRAVVISRLHQSPLRPKLFDLLVCDVRGEDSKSLIKGSIQLEIGEDVGRRHCGGNNHKEKRKCSAQPLWYS
jgi:hypothetical protein